MDATGHHLLIEKCHGSYGVYQAYITQLGYGYTASEWCFGDMRQKPAWKRYGGGMILADKDISYLLDLVVKWQKLTQKMLTSVLSGAVPGLDPAAIPHLHKPQIGPSAPRGLLQGALTHVRFWSQRMINRIGPEGCTDIGLNPLDRHASRAVDILIGYPHDGECVFTIPADMHNECNSLSREMTGEPVVSAAFFFYAEQWNVLGVDA